MRAGVFGMALLLSVGVAAACGSSSTIAKPTGHTVTVADADSGRTVNAHRGDTVVISLADPGDDGYAYRFGTQASAKVLTYEGFTHQAPPTSNPQPLGNFGKDVYKYKAIAAGTTTIDLDQVRPSGGDRGSSFKVTIAVSK